jgi:hypothetical protein
MAEAALAAAAAEWLRQRWLRQRRNGCGSGGDLCLVALACVSAAFWLRQRLRRRQDRQRWLRQWRRLVSGSLGLCFCGFMAEAVAETCVWWPGLVFLRLSG